MAGPLAPPSRHGSAPARVGRAAIAGALALAVTVSGCAWRLESEPLVTPSPDAATLTRDAAARREADVVLALARTASTPGEGVLYDVAARVAPLHLELLGGVYVPFPGATPSPSAAPPADPTPVSLQDAVTAARDGALADAFADSASPAGFRAGSMGFTYALTLWWAQQVDAADGATQDGATQDTTTADTTPAVSAPVTVRALPWSGTTDATVPTVPGASAVDATALADLAVMHDEARFLYEVVAARHEGQERTDLMARAALHGARGDALVALAGTDLRTPVYELPDARVATAADAATACREVEQAIGWRYMELTWGTDATDRAWLMDFAFDAYAASALLPGFTTAQIPTLPGAAS